MLKIGLSSGKNITRELFAAYRNAGIDAMEISVSTEEYDQLDYKLLSEFAREYNIGLWSFHLPFNSEKLDISVVEVRKYANKYLGELIKKAADIGIDKFVIHPSREPISDDLRYERMEGSKESLAELSEVATQCGAVIAVENLPRTCLGKNSAEIKELINVHNNLKVCFDTNHLLNESAVDFIHNLNDKIITTHISDYDFVNERHWLPGEGMLDWKAVIQALEEINYNGVWMYEIGFECPKTIIRNRSLTCGDFVRNANELFKGGEITVISQPKPNLGMWE